MNAATLSNDNDSDVMLLAYSHCTSTDRGDSYEENGAGSLEAGDTTSPSRTSTCSADAGISTFDVGISSADPGISSADPGISSTEAGTCSTGSQSESSATIGALCTLRSAPSAYVEPPGNPWEDYPDHEIIPNEEPEGSNSPTSLGLLSGNLSDSTSLMSGFSSGSSVEESGLRHLAGFVAAFDQDQETNLPPTPVVITPLPETEQEGRAVPDVTPIVIEPITNPSTVTSPLQPVTGNSVQLQVLHQEVPNANLCLGGAVPSLPMSNDDYPQHGHCNPVHPVAPPPPKYPQLRQLLEENNHDQDSCRLPEQLDVQQPNPVPAYGRSMNIIAEPSGQPHPDDNKRHQGQMMMSQVQPNITGGSIDGGLLTQQFTHSSNDTCGQKRKSMSSSHSSQQYKKRKPDSTECSNSTSTVQSTHGVSGQLVQSIVQSMILPWQTTVEPRVKDRPAAPERSNSTDHYLCKICLAQHKSAEDHQNHCRDVHKGPSVQFIVSDYVNGQSFSCRYCDLGFSDVASITSHIGCHFQPIIVQKEPVKTYQCPVCLKNVTSKFGICNHFRKHYRSTVRGNTTYIHCPLCPTLTGQIREMNNHVIYQHCLYIMDTEMAARKPSNTKGQSRMLGLVPDEEERQDKEQEMRRAANKSPIHVSCGKWPGHSVGNGDNEFESSTEKDLPTTMMSMSDTGCTQEGENLPDDPAIWKVQEYNAAQSNGSQSVPEEVVADETENLEERSDITPGNSHSPTLSVAGLEESLNKNMCKRLSELSSPLTVKGPGSEYVQEQYRISDEPHVPSPEVQNDSLKELSQWETNENNYGNASALSLDPVKEASASHIYSDVPCIATKEIGVAEPCLNKDSNFYDDSPVMPSRMDRDVVSNDILGAMMTTQQLNSSVQNVLSPVTVMLSPNVPGPILKAKLPDESENYTIKYSTEESVHLGNSGIINEVYSLINAGSPQGQLNAIPNPGPQPLTQTNPAWCTWNSSELNVGAINGKAVNEEEAERDSGDTGMQANTCTADFRVVKDLRLALRTPFQYLLCPICGTICQDGRGYIIHLKSHLSNGMHSVDISCTFCNKTFGSLFPFIYHMRLHMACDKIKKCFCGKHVSSEDKLIAHLKEFHKELDAEEVLPPDMFLKVAKQDGYPKARAGNLEKNPSTNVEARGGDVSLNIRSLLNLPVNDPTLWMKDLIHVVNDSTLEKTNPVVESQLQLESGTERGNFPKETPVAASEDVQGRHEDVITDMITSEEFQDPITSTRFSGITNMLATTPNADFRFENLNVKFRDLACPICGHISQDGRAYIPHLRSHLTEGVHSVNIICAFCDMTFSSLSPFVYHMRIHIRFERKKMCFCRKHVSSVDKLIAHLKEFHKELDVEEVISSGMFTKVAKQDWYQKERPEHMETQESQEAIVIPFLEENPDAAMYTCTNEGSVTKNNIDLELPYGPGLALYSEEFQNPVTSTGVEDFALKPRFHNLSCPICDKIFRDGRTYIPHLNMHLMEGVHRVNISCAFCDISFGSLFPFIYHIRIHIWFETKKSCFCRKYVCTEVKLLAHLKEFHKDLDVEEVFPPGMFNKVAKQDGYDQGDNYATPCFTEESDYSGDCGVVTEVRSLNVSYINASAQNISNVIPNQGFQRLTQTSPWNSSVLNKYAIKGQDVHKGEAGRDSEVTGMSSTTHTPDLSVLEDFAVKNQFHDLLCPICDKIFQDGRAYIPHLQMHLRFGVHSVDISCAFCNKTFGSLSPFIYHMRLHITCGKWKMCFCSKFVSSEDKLIAHLKEFHKELDVEEVLPPGMYNKVAKQDGHQMSRTSNFQRKRPNEDVETCITKAGDVSMNIENQFHDLLCPICGEIFQDGRAYIPHLQTHLRCGVHSVDISCAFCDMTFSTLSPFVYHMRIHIRVERNKVCFCGKSVSSEDKLIAHLKEFHKELNVEEVLPPGMFNKVAKQDWYQKERPDNMETEESQEEFQDPVTSTGVEGTALMTHQFHNLLCPICDRIFQDGRAYIPHLKNHLMEGVHSVNIICAFCDMTFSTLSPFVYHMRIHIRVERNKVCFCGKSVNSEDKLIAHLKEFHKELDVEEVLPPGMFNKVAKQDWYQKERPDNMETQESQEEFQDPVTSSWVEDTALMTHQFHNLLCPICDEIFQDGRSCIPHLKDHLKEGVHSVNIICAFCDMTFSSLFPYFYHMRICTWFERKKMCFCRKYVGRKVKLISHLKEFHKELDVEEVLPPGMFTKVVKQNGHQMSRTSTYPRERPTEDVETCVTKAGDVSLNIDSPFFVSMKDQSLSGSESTLSAHEPSRSQWLCNSSQSGEDLDLGRENSFRNMVPFYDSEEEDGTSTIGYGSDTEEELTDISTIKTEPGQVIYDPLSLETCFGDQTVLDNTSTCGPFTSILPKSGAIASPQEGRHNEVISHISQKHPVISLKKEKKHKCDICGHAFLSPKNLKYHSWMHTGVKLCQCEICGKKFSRPDTLILHMRYHNNCLPYCCLVCGKGYNRPSELTAHIRIRHKDIIKSESMGLKDHNEDSLKENNESWFHNNPKQEMDLPAALPVLGSNSGPAYTTNSGCNPSQGYIPASFADPEAILRTVCSPSWTPFTEPLQEIQFNRHAT